MRFLRGEPKFDFVGRMGLFGWVSGVLVAASVVAIAAMGLNFGIDFAGGYEVQVQFPKAVTESDIRDVLAPVGLGDARVQRYGAEGENSFLVMVREHGTMTEDTKAQMQVAFETLGGVEAGGELPAWVLAESGESLRVGFAKAVTEAQVREVLGQFPVTLKSLVSGERTDAPVFTATFVSLAEQIESALRKGLAIGDDVELVSRVEFVGPQVGAQLRNQGIMAVLYALGFILLYIAVRFDLFFSPGAVVALIHDVTITLGFFALFQLEFNLPIVAAILALVGYSLNDTIVVYDRIRENGIRLKGRKLRALVNTSINQTLSRTLLTSGTTLLVVLALLLMGGGTIRDFSVALFIGILVGTYSSVGIASPVYIMMRERGEARAAARTAAGGGGGSARAGGGGGGGGSGGGVVAA